MVRECAIEKARQLAAVAIGPDAVPATDTAVLDSFVAVSQASVSSAQLRVLDEHDSTDDVVDKTDLGSVVFRRKASWDETVLAKPIRQPTVAAVNSGDSDYNGVTDVHAGAVSACSGCDCCHTAYHTGMPSSSRLSCAPVTSPADVAQRIIVGAPVPMPATAMRFNAEQTPIDTQRDPGTRAGVDSKRSGDVYNDGNDQDTDDVNGQPEMGVPERLFTSLFDRSHQLMYPLRPWCRLWWQEVML